MPFRNLSLQTSEDDVTDLTTVELLWLEKRIENRIRFGRAVAEQIIDCRRRILSFAPGTVFAFVRWASNDFGTVISRVDILRAATPGQRYSTVPWVKPGDDILGSSWNRVGKFEGLKGRKARYFRDLLHFCRVQNLAQMLDGKDIETSSAALGYVFI